MRRILYITSIAVLTGLAGCHEMPPAEYPETTALGLFTENFAAAVQKGDANAVYDMLDEDVTGHQTREEFSEYFSENRGIFEIYAQRMQDAYAASTFSFIALREGDPCGTASLERSTGAWKMRDVPDAASTAAEAVQKKALLDAICSRTFLELLNQYSKSHPEWDKNNQRKLRRMITFGSIRQEDITFRDNRAIIDVRDTTKIQMVCEKQGWRLDRCTSYR